MGNILNFVKPPVLPSATDQSLSLPVDYETPSVKKINKNWCQIKQI